MSDALRAKAAARVKAAALPIAEKLRMLERLRERDRAIKRAVAAPDTSPSVEQSAEMGSGTSGTTTPAA